MLAHPGIFPCYRQAFRIPAAIAIMSRGTSSRIPPAKSRQKISTGNARPIRMLAAFFAMPYVNLNAKPTAFTRSQIKIATVSNSNIFVPFDE